MKSVVAALGVFAAVANAHYQAPRHFHFRRTNGTDYGHSTSSVPLSTGVYPTGPGGYGSYSTTDITIDKTVTLTLGTGTYASIVTTTLHSTIHTTVSVPAYTNGDDFYGAKAEDTTYVTLHSTGYVTETVTEASVTETQTASPDDNDSSDCGTATTTVTVYVTVGADGTGSSGSSTTPPASSVTDESCDGDDGEDDDGDYCDDVATTADAETTVDATTTIDATVTVVPYPNPTNGTHVTSGIAGPSGFARRIR